MFNLDITGGIILFAAATAEIILTVAHNADNKLKKDMIINFLIGVCLLLVGLFEKGLAFGFFSLVYRFAIFTPGYSWWLWIVGFLGCELSFYLSHRIGHTTRLFWAVHVTHHSSQYFNLTVAGRVNFIFLLYRSLFWAPLCFFGIPPEMILLIESITAIPTFLIHTEKVGKLGVLDWIFNTPSNHRVHHASNPEYLDKNFGGVLMIYDHLFGTYIKETAAPVYGLTHNIDTHNPGKLLLDEFAKVAREFVKIKKIPAKFRYLFSRPQ
jgi:sterol desaturase/sphingolipid hydroxylase (fatty acid hydroxylase superfamily)